MKQFVTFLATLLIFSSFTAVAQKGPGGVGNNDGTSTLHHWYRADQNVVSAAGVVSAWNDNSGYGTNLTQGVNANRPTITTNASLNGQSVIRYVAASNQFFTSSSTGPSSFNLTLFVVARGTNYQSLIRFQDVSSPFVVYPWSGGQTFITSSDGGTGGGIASGLVANANNVGGARFRTNIANGMQTFLNGGVNAQRASNGSVLPTATLQSGKYPPGAEYPDAEVGEMMVYYSALNDAQMIIVQNYLAAKFNVTLTSNDVYTMDNNANGDFDYDVAGIGQVDASNSHTDAQGTGILRILNPTDLQDGEYLMWGHNNLSAVASNTSDIPPGVTGRFNRVWRASEVGNTGNIDLQFDVSGLSDFTSLSPCDAASSIRLLVDTDNDGIFADQTPISGATNIGGNVYRFANINAINNQYRFTLAIVSAGVTGPGGVGGTNGTTNLKLWMDAGRGVTTSAGAVTNWADQSGNGINAVPPPFAAARPLLTASVLNSRPVLTFASSNLLELSTNINTSTPTMFMVANKTTPGTGYMTILTLQQNLWLVQGSGLDQWGMWNNTDVYSGQTLNTIYRVMSSMERSFNDVDLFTDEVGVTRTNGTAFHGKTIGTIGSNNNGSTNTGTQFFNGNLAEMIVFNTILNSAQRIIVDNYLAAKYGLPLSANDVYTRDNSANGNFDFEVAGIGRVNATNFHSDAKGSGLVRVSNPTDLGDSEFFMWGHNNLPVVANLLDLPTGIDARWPRTWSVSETGEVGNIDIQFDLTGQGAVTASDLRLLIDHDDDGVFNEAGTIQVSGATALSCNNYIFTGVSAINNAMRFTLGTVNRTSTPLPITLTSFTGVVRDGMTELKWQTSSEINNDYFSIERSQDGEKFTWLVDVKGAGQSTTARSYSTIDNSPPVGKIYYRLKQTDFDGKSTFSKIIALDNADDSPRIIVSPNPVKMGQDIQVRISNAQSENVGFLMYDVVGRIIPVTYERDGNIFNVKTDKAKASGFYILRVISPNFNLLQRIYIAD